MEVQSFRIESRQEADDYLADLFGRPEYRSMDEAKIRARSYIQDPKLKDYFLQKAEEILRQ
ncbi:hypothetical protein Acid7E03_01800 [Acidisoma sp. 7E03]